MSTKHPHLTADEIKKVAKLARLHIDDSEIPAHVKNLSDILDLIAEIDSKDTSSVIPMTSPFQDAKLPLRKDIVTEQNQRAILQKLAPQVEGGLYIVPKVIE